MCHPFITVARKEVYYRNLNHCVASRLLAHRSAGYTYQHLSRQGRIVDFHIKLEQLVMRLARYTFANQVHAVAYIVQVIHTSYLFHVRFVIHEIRVSLDGCFYLLEVGTFFQFYIHHTAMDSCTYRNGH